MSADKPRLTIDLNGVTDTQGTVEGSGALTINVTDAAQAALNVDYSTADKVTVTLSSAAGFTLRSHHLTLNAAGAVKPLSGEWLGTAGLTFEVSRNVAMQLQQQWARAGNTTSLGVTIHLG
jgi:hypothetical protein